MSDNKSTLVITPTVVQSNIDTIRLKWEYTSESDVFKVERHITKENDWQIVYWGGRNECIVTNLDENFAFRFRVIAMMCMNGQRYQEVARSNDFIAATLPDIPSTVSIQRAIKKGQHHVIKKYLKLKPQLFQIVGPAGLTPLAVAAKLGARDIADELIKSGGIDINVGCPITLRSPLHLAVFHGNVDVAKLLLERNANRHATDRCGMHFGHYAIDSGELKSVKFVVDNGVDVEEKDHLGWTMLLRAVAFGCSQQILQFLLDSGCSVIAVDKRKNDILKLSTIFGNNEIKVVLGL